ncbi:MAG: sensor histidine kinase [Verrucomicrobia bacterium]|nr:sensor histidine kinase [Verrucomicrobiota bacterium]
MMDLTQDNDDHLGHLGPSLFTVENTTEIAERDATPHESLLHKTRLLMGINDLAIELNKADPDTNISKIVTERLRDICGAVMTIISSYRRETKSILINHVASNRWDIKAANRITRTNVAQLELPVPDDIYARWMSKRIEVFESTYDLTLGSIPKTVCQLVDKALRLGYTYGILLHHHGEVTGVVTIMMPAKARPLPLDVIDAIANMLSASLQRIEAQRTLALYQEELRSLASELSLAEERERRRIATLMHDEVTQTLALMAIRLGQLLAKDVGKDSLSLLEEVSDLLDKSIHQTRTLTFELSSPILYELGLEPALQWLAEQLEEQHGITTEWHGDGDKKPLTDDLCVVLFQTVRELLVNVRKHARASHVDVSCSRENNCVKIVVKDDGSGFTPAAIGRHNPKAGGFGLFSIRERLGRLGASVKIDSEPGAGTLVTLTAPLNTENDSGGSE